MRMWNLGYGGTDAILSFIQSYFFLFTLNTFAAVVVVNGVARWLSRMRDDPRTLMIDE